MSEPHLWTLTQTVEALQAGQVSAAELTAWALDRIARFAPGLNAFVAVSETATETARALDERRAQGFAPGPLAGVPIAVKDLLDTARLPSAYGGKHFHGHVPEYSATVVQRLEAAGAIIIGKTNLHEYAYGTTSENPHYGDVRNPRNRSKITGGSSGGSAAAVTAGLCSAAIGTDTGGSIRIPAALTGHVGLKPSYGLVSKRGVFPLANTLDHVGPMTRTVADAALLLDIIAGHDPADGASARVPLRSYQNRKAPRTIKAGIPKAFFFEKCHPNVSQVVQTTLQRLEKAGVEFCEVEIPFIHEVPDMQATVIDSEALSVHEQRLAEEPELFGEDVRQRLTVAQQIPSSRYVTAQVFRKRFKRSLENVFAAVDILVTPTTPLPTTDIGQTKAHIRAHEVNVRSHLTRYTNPWNFSGLPAISIPCGQTTDDLPVGLQLIGSMFAEQKLLSVAQMFEDAIGWDPIAPDYH